MMNIRYKRIRSITEGIVRRITTVGGMGEQRNDVKQLENYGFSSAPREGFLALETKTWDEDDTSAVILSVSQPSGKRVLLNPGCVAMYTDFDNGWDQFHRIEMDANTGNIRIHAPSISLESTYISLNSNMVAMTSPPVIVEGEKLQYTVPTRWIDCVKSALTMSRNVSAFNAAYMEFREQNGTVWVQGKFTATRSKASNREDIDQHFVILRVPLAPRNDDVDMRFLGGGSCRIRNANNSHRNDVLFVDEGVHNNVKGARVWLPSFVPGETMECNVHYTYKV